MELLSALNLSWLHWNDFSTTCTKSILLESVKTMPTVSRHQGVAAAAKDWPFLHGQTFIYLAEQPNLASTKLLQARKTWMAGA